jgi:hypothetical protein
VAQSIIFPEWLNSNSVRNYPIAENCSRIDKSGSYTISNDLIVSAQVNHSRAYADGVFFISGLFVSVPVIKISISYQPEDTLISPTYISTIEIDTKNFSKFSYYSFIGQNENSSVLGAIAVGDIAETINRGLGNFDFDSSSTKLEINCRFVSMPSMQYIDIYDSNNVLIHRATDVLKIKAGQNVRITYDPLINIDTGETDQYGCVKIDAIVDENVIKEPDGCETAKAFYSPCIKTINGVRPDSNGNFWIEESECIGIDEYKDANSIKVNDLCSSSCCGCVDLEFLTAGLEQLKQQEERLRELVLTTQGTQSELLANLIANL